MDATEKLDLSLWPTFDHDAGEPGPRKNENPHCFLVVRSLFHRDIADAMSGSCLSTLEHFGVKAEMIHTLDVPGSFEIAPAITAFCDEEEAPPVAAAIALGAIIQGQTSHFDHICAGTVSALSTINATAGFPVIFGILTTASHEEAWERADPEQMDKGREMALTALWMANMPTS